MGYHKVIATLNTGGKESGFIFNSTIFLKESEAQRQMPYGWDCLLSEAAKSPFIVEGLTVIPREPETLKGVRQVAIAHEKFHMLANRAVVAANTAYGIQRTALLLESRQLELNAKSAAAEDAPVTLTEAGEAFRRFSAFANDRRVTSGMGLVAGTFATTREDADANVRTGMDAVARYALPNPAPASNVFAINPPTDSELRRGTAQPANNQPGGGVEVIFVNGLPDGTVTGPTRIPDR